MAKKVGRPKKHNKAQVAEISEKLSNYIDKEDLPILAEFAYTNDIPRQTFYDYEEFSTLVKKLFDKKEAQLEKLASFNVINNTMAVFSLKQLGWRDNKDVKIEQDEPFKIETKAERKKRVLELQEKMNKCTQKDS